MVNVANDRGLRDVELPSAAAAASPAVRELVAGLSLERLLALPSLAGVRVATTAPDVSAGAGAVLTRASLLGAPQASVPPCAGHLVVVPADVLARHEAQGHDVVAALASAGAGALLVTGVPAATADELEATRERAALHGIPLLLLDGGEPDAVVTEVLGALLDQQTAILARVDEAHRILVDVVLAGGGLEDLCERLAGFLGGAAMVTSTDGRVLAEAGSEQALTAAHALDCFDRTGRLVTEREAVGTRPPGTPVSGRALVRIVAGGLGHGLLAAFVQDRSLTADDVHLLERAATVAALAITKEQAVSAVESKYRAEFLRDALAGRAGAPAEALLHAAALGWDIDRPLVVVVAETYEDDEHTTRTSEEVTDLQQRFSRAWSRAMAVRDPRAPVMGFSQEVVALFAVPGDADTDTVMRSVGEVVRVVRGDGGGGRRTFSTGVSRPVESPADLPRAYEEALSAVSVGRQLNGDGSVAHFDQLGIYRLLALVPDSADLRRFVEEALGPLADDDVPEHADLRTTLSILIDTNMNVAETARLLFFHYNTLRYRIAKLERMLGPFTTDPQLRLKLALALKVHQMRGI
ncbi:helix-turn-helix domain-containing protein [Phycicoccus sp. M110.8]|uniref:PucR family transcriptional regulator n=1 Tax=Phycicoccus sp. M110.8 TaxID=3075433 RepID=UPI0028FD8716|nr:helix-turn-helix domain-containing protein [Phycicoccus sp. M110.8]MDU0312828.1 helix-turn-helix domain-containing protein [Phycicoccus sp. M110.8]